MEKTRLEQDLAATVQELSSTYEELSFLYRISGLFSSLSIDDICEKMMDEAVCEIGVVTAAVLFLDEPRGMFTTKTCRGAWDPARTFGREAGVFWQAVRKARPVAFCNLRETEHCLTFPELGSMMVAPLAGKERVVGAIVVADKENGGEFFSSDTKLLNAISFQAGLSIENAMLYQELEGLLIGAIRSLVKALEASSKWTAGHTERVTEYAMGIAGVLEVGSDVIEKVKITALLHDIGKIATPREILDKNSSLNEEELKVIRRHPGTGAEILRELRQFEDIILSIKYHHEFWDGSRGLFGLKQEEIPFMARILSVADAFDAMTSDRPYRAKMTKAEAVEEIIRCAGTQFDPGVVDAFLRWAGTVTLPHSASGP